jgi:DNA-binding transcriptional regulator YdaS (Cro superfamily)
MQTYRRTPAQAIEATMKHCQLKAGEFAARIGLSPQMVSFLRSGDRSVPPEKVPLICSLADVKRWELRPTDWHKIWPELVGTKGAPPVPVEADKAEAR